MQPLDYWYTRRQGLHTDSCFTSVAFGNGTFVVASQRQPSEHLSSYGPSDADNECSVMTSADGLAWAASPPLFWACHLEGITDVVFGNNVFIVAVHAYDLNREYPSPRFYSSSDNGLTWSDHFGPWESIGLPRLAFGAGRFVAAGYAGVLISEDHGNSWKLEKVVGLADKQYCHLQDITYGLTPQGQGLFVAVGGMTAQNDPLRPNKCEYTQACIATSVGSGWYGAALPAPNTLQGVAYGNNRFVAIGRHEILYSSDTFVWEPARFQRACSFNGIAFGAGHFVIVTDEGYIYASVDGEVWSRHLVSEGTSLYDATFNDNTCLVIGEHGKIFQSALLDAKFLTLEIFGPGAVGLKPPDIICGYDTTLPYRPGQRVHLSAITEIEPIPPEPPEPPRAQRRYGPLKIPIIFEGWSGDVQGTARERTLLMDSDKLVQASFALPKFEKPDISNKLPTRQLHGLTGTDVTEDILGDSDK